MSWEQYLIYDNLLALLLHLLPAPHLSHSPVSYLNLVCELFLLEACTAPNTMWAWSLICIVLRYKQIVINDVWSTECSQGPRTSERVDGIQHLIGVVSERRYIRTRFLAEMASGLMLFVLLSRVWLINFLSYWKELIIATFNSMFFWKLKQNIRDTGFILKQ